MKKNIESKTGIGKCASCEKYNNEDHQNPCFWNRQNVHVDDCVDYKEVDKIVEIANKYIDKYNLNSDFHSDLMEILKDYKAQSAEGSVKAKVFEVEG